MAGVNKPWLVLVKVAPSGLGFAVVVGRLARFPLSFDKGGKQTGSQDTHEEQRKILPAHLYKPPTAMNKP